MTVTSSVDFPSSMLTDMIMTPHNPSFSKTIKTVDKDFADTNPSSDDLV